MTEVTRHFTTAVYIVHENRILLHAHKKLKILLAVGGHIDRDETPAEAALREIAEETGLSVELYNPKGEERVYPDGSRDINTGSNCNLHRINEFHEHMSFEYYARALTTELNPEEGESTDFVWLSKEELETSENILENVRVRALDALQILKS